MAENWTHDRPSRASTRKSRRHVVEQPRLELPVPMPVEPREAEAKPTEEPERGFAFIDFYV